MGTPHVLAIPYPAQGHVIPLLELSQCLVTHGCKVTFVNSEFNHKRVVNALSNKDHVRSHINLVSITDGLEPWEDRNDLGKLTEAILKVMPVKLEELIEQVNRSEKTRSLVLLQMAAWDGPWKLQRRCKSSGERPFGLPQWLCSHWE